MGTYSRLMAIADALANESASNASSPAATPSASVCSSASQRLNDIQLGLATRYRAGPLACISNRPQASSSTQVDRKQRLKDIQEGLAMVKKDMNPQGPPSCMLNRSSQKRALSSAPEAEPQAKRHKVEDQPCKSPGVNPQQPVKFESHASTASLITVAATVPSNSEYAEVEGSFEKIDPFDDGRKNYIAEFFAGYPQFHYNPSSSVWVEFHRMLRWDTEKKREGARKDLRDALTEQFNSIYGTDVENIKNWQLLCRVLGISPVSEDLDECRHVVLNTHVNLVDLVMHQTDSNEPVKLFKTERELSEYTQRFRKYFPRDSIHAGGLLKFLLRHILNPPLEKRVRRWRR